MKKARPSLEGTELIENIGSNNKEEGVPGWLKA
jgi:hypothetical protein